MESLENQIGLKGPSSNLIPDSSTFDRIGLLIKILKRTHSSAIQ